MINDNEDLPRPPQTLEGRDIMINSNNDISNDPRYTAMTFDTAVYICDRFVAEFGGMTAVEVEQAPEGQTALVHYGFALGWLIREDRWQEAGIDPEFVVALQGGDL